MATRQKRKTLSGTRSKVKFTKKKATSTDRTPSLRGKGLEHAVEQFQAEPDEKRFTSNGNELSLRFLACSSRTDGARKLDHPACMEEKETGRPGADTGNLSRRYSPAARVDRE